MAFCASPLFQCILRDAPPAEMSLCSIVRPRAAARAASIPGTLLRAVKLLPTNRILVGLPLSSSACATRGRGICFFGIDSSMNPIAFYGGFDTVGEREIYPVRPATQ